LLKSRCVSRQTGQPHPKDLLCGSATCPGGYFCGKVNENPNYGVTNYDTIFYSFLTTFQCVTLEGWSDIMVLMEQVYLPIIIYLFFVPLVFIGAFFLLNLTLAVINSSFTETHKRHQAQEQDDKAAGKEVPQDEEEKMEKRLQDIDELSITQFITARIYAKKMIEFLRMRQKIKQIERERIEMLKARSR